MAASRPQQDPPRGAIDAALVGWLHKRPSSHRTLESIERSYKAYEAAVEGSIPGM